MNISKNKMISFGILGVLFLIIAFFLGASYGAKQARAIDQKGNQTFSQNMPGGNRMRGGANGGFANGKIISKDANSITIELMTGGPNGGTATGSKIVLFDSNTKVNKQTTGALSDLMVGTTVSVTGTPNTDGSINATTVQIRAVNKSNTTP